MTSSRRVREIVEAAEGGAEGASRVTRLCGMLAAAVPVDGVGLSVCATPGKQSRVAATDVVSGHIEDLQVLLGQGPCVDAVATGLPVLVPDLDLASAADRWPAFVPAAAAAGVRASFAVPLLAGGVRLGSIDLYRDSVGSLDDAQLDEAQTFARAAVEVLLTLQHGHPQGDLAAGLVPGWSGSSLVHQATGMVMAQLEVDAEAAFATLRAHAFQAAEPLQDVARQVLERTLRFDGPRP